jgi:hypothetical protein
LFELSSQEKSYHTPIIISGVIGAAVGAFTTKVIITIRKQKSPKPIPTQSKTPQEKVQCKVCGKMLPKFFKFCPFCATQI